MHKKWQQELNKMKLTPLQKERVKERVKQPSVNRRKSFVPIIGPAFGMLAVFLIWLNIQDGTNYKTASQDIKKEITYQSLNLEITLWVTATLVLLMASYVLFILNCLKVKRWQHSPFIQKVQLMLKSWKIIWLVFSVLLLQAIVWLGVFYLPYRLLFVQAIFSIFLITLILLLQIYWTRDLLQAHCPHCGEVFTRKQARKKATMAFRETCDACGELVYPDRKVTQKQAPFYLIAPICITLQWTGIHGVYTLGILIITAIFSVFFIAPYMTQFTKESEEQQPPLW
ncbi:hypothetical protein [Lysinibacillus sp. LZ02]|uniref:hypothetical protein n=1 Tax=Lysinibacillus sp. LZ02 TaxID=3420668 RepID=UPI003D35F0E7